MRNRLNIDDDTFVFGSIGSLIPRKANHHTLEALAQFNQKHPEARWKMVLVGEGLNAVRWRHKLMRWVLLSM